MGQDARVGRHQRGAVGAHGAVRRDVLAADRLRLGQEPRPNLGDGQRARRERGLLHALERPEQVDGGRPRRREALDGELEVGDEAVETHGPALPGGERDAERRRHAEGGGAADHDRPDRVGDVLPALVPTLDVARGQERLVEQHEPVVGPVNRIDGCGSHCRGVLEAGVSRGWPEIEATRLRSPVPACAVWEPGASRGKRLFTVASSRPAMLTSLSRPRVPRTTLMDEGGTRSAPASRALIAAFAAPSTGGAVTRTRRAPFCQPTISSREARGCTRSGSRTPSGLGVRVFTELRRHHPVVALERGAEVLDELAAQAPERLDLAADPRLLGPPLLDDLLAAELGFPHQDVGLATRRGLHLVAQPMRGDQRVLQRALPLGEAAGALLERSHLLLELRVLLEHRLVVFGDVVQEGVDLVDVEAAEPLDRELLLTDIERADAHRGLRLLSYADREVSQGLDDHPFDDLEGEQYDQRRQVQVQGHRQPVADRAQDGLGHAVQKAHDRVVGVRVHPGDQRAGDDDPEVYPEGDFEHPRDREDDITQDEHYVGPCPSSRERSVARSTALMKVVRMPPSSSAATPAIDVPPGELTMSLSAPGCRPVSSRSFAAPRTVWVARVIAVIRSRPMRTPPSASDSITTAT